jgi:hypothetical protein
MPGCLLAGLVNVGPDDCAVQDAVPHPAEGRGFLCWLLPPGWTTAGSITTAGGGAYVACTAGADMNDSSP